MPGPVQMVDREGNVEVIEDLNEARSRYASGQWGFVEGQRVNVVDRQTGEVGTVEANELSQAFGAGMDLAAPDEVQEAERQAEFGDAPIQTALEAGASRLTFGASDFIAQDAALSDEQRQRIRNQAFRGRGDVTAAQEQYEAGTGLRERRARNETAATVGAIGGEVAALALSGGTSASRTLGSLAARVVGREGLETGARGVLRSAIGLGVEGAAEGALAGANQVISESALGPGPLTAERVAAGVGMGALIGTGAGAGLGTMAGLSRPALEQVGRMGRSGRESLSRMWTRTEGTELRPGVADYFANVSSMSAGREHRDFIARAVGLTDEGRRVRDIIRRGDEPIQEAVPRMRELLDADEAIARQTQDFSRGQLKYEPIRREIDHLALERGADQALTLTQRMRALADDIKANPGIYQQAGGAGRNLRKVADDFTERLDNAIARGGAEGGADMFVALDMAKRRLGRLTRTRDPYAREQLDELYHAVRDHLEDAEIYGGAAAIQREINAAWSPFISNSKEFRRRFLSKSGESEGFDDLWTADPAKVEKYLRSVGTSRGQLDDEIFRRHIELRQNLNEAIAKHLDVPDDLKAAVEAGRKNVADLRAQLEQADEVHAVINQYKDLSSAAGETSAVIPAGVGFAVAGPLGAAAASAVSRPDQVIRTLTALDAVARRVDERMALGVKKYLRRLTGGERKAAKQITPGATEQAAGDAQRGRKASRAKTAATVFTLEQYRDEINRYQEAASNPEAHARRIAERTAPIADAAPTVHAQMAMASNRAVQFMLSKVPPLSRPRAGVFSHVTPNRPPSDTEMERFMRYARAVNDPTTILDDLEEGRLSREGVEAVREVYPTMYEQLVANVMDGLTEAKEPPPYQARLQLGVLLGVETDPSLRPRFIATMQATSTTVSPQPQSPAAPPQEAPDISGSMLSESQRLDRRRSATG